MFRPMTNPSLRLLKLRLGELDVRVLEPEEPVGELFNVVLCHGFGAPGDDLVGLGPELVREEPKLAGRVRFVFPSAPLDLAHLGMPFGRAWWHLDIENLMAGRDWARMHAEEPEGLPRSRRLLLAALDELQRTTKTPLSRTFLGGFSQGAMITTDLALHLEEAPAGLIVLSGTVISRDEWKRRAPGRAGLHAFQSHGTHDEILPFPPAEELRDLLGDAGIEVDFTPFAGPHGIPMDVLERLSSWLARRIG